MKRAAYEPLILFLGACLRRFLNVGDEARAVDHVINDKDLHALVDRAVIELTLLIPVILPSASSAIATVEKSDATMRINPTR